MAVERRRSRLLQHLGSPWVIGTAVVALVVAVIQLAPDRVPEPPLQLVALGPDGAFRDTLVVPATWQDTSTSATGQLRVPLVLGVRNTGARTGRPDRLSVSLPFQYRLVDPEGALEAEREAGSPLVTYTVETGLDPVEPGRLPTLLPALDTLWLEVVVPAYHCMALADSIPELIPAPRPPLSTLTQVRVFYSFEGGDLTRRRTGTLTVRLDTALLDLERPEPPPSFPVITDTALASPEVGPLRRVGARRTGCGEPQDPFELRSTLWVTADGGQVITLEHGGVVRKRLYDLDADGVVERESWDADGDGTFETTRQARLSIPAFLLPVRVPGPEADSLPFSTD